MPRDVDDVESMELRGLRGSAKGGRKPASLASANGPAGERKRKPFAPKDRASSSTEALQKREAEPAESTSLRHDKQKYAPSSNEADAERELSPSVDQLGAVESGASNQSLSNPEEPLTAAEDFADEDLDEDAEDEEFEDDEEDDSPVHDHIPFDDDQPKVLLVLFPTWRSQLFKLIGFFVLSIVAIIVTGYFPEYLVIKGKLFTLGNTHFALYLPVLTLPAGYILATILIAVYDARFIVDANGVEAQIGLVSLSLRQPRLTFDDIRGVEPKQTLLERILGIGSLYIGSAMTFEAEIIMEGISDPRAVQQFINRERDKYLRERRKSVSTPPTPPGPLQAGVAR